MLSGCEQDTLSTVREPLENTVRALRVQESGVIHEIPSGAGRLVLGTERTCDIVVDDPYVSSEHCVFERRSHALLVVDRRSKNGTYLNGSRVRTAELRAGNLVTVGKTTLVGLGSSPTTRQSARDRLEGRAPAFLRAIDMSLRAAVTECSTLIVGETGTGKELFARAIHEASHRRQGPFVALNCGALPRELIGSELFGHVRGAFTGATEHRRGLFESAAGGTLFLDELGELPAELQPHLLRALETRMVRPVGGHEERPIDVRLVAATNRLDIGTNRSHLRTDLYHRVATVVIELPPLRERIDDLPLLIDAFLKELEPEFGARRISPETVARLGGYRWPGNVRELRHSIQRAVALCRDELEIEVLLPSTRQPTEATRPLVEGKRGAPPQALPLNDVLRQVMSRAYEEHGSIRRAARALGIPKSTFADRAKRLGLITTRLPSTG